MGSDKKPWIVRDYQRCSGCRRCEIACSISHEGRIWPEASRVRVFMLVPGAEIPHLCAQCPDYPCVASCPSKALSVDKNTSAVVVDDKKCTACGACIRACPGSVPHMHPRDKHIVICDLCGGEPQCVKACTVAGYGALRLVKEKAWPSHKLFARKPEELTRDLAENLYAEKAKELM